MQSEVEMTIRWDIRREGRAWTDDFWGRWNLTPEKFESMDGKVFLDENERINMLGLLLENVGVDAAVRLGALEVWEAAIAACRGQPRELISRRPGGWDVGYEGEYPTPDQAPP
jgi:hypothetical protein